MPGLARLIPILVRLMSRTSTTLLSRLQACSDQESWQQWLEVYEPLIRNWLRQFAECGADHEDVVQEVLAVVVRKLPEFQRRDQVGSFRSWLRTITRNCLR